jgi:DNA-binding NarL/FixJ family response regulator
VIGQTRYVREAVLNQIGQDGRFIAVDLGVNGPECLDRARHLRPDVVLFDVPSEVRASVSRTLLEACPNVALIALGIEREERDALPLLEAGVKGYVHRDQTLRDILDVVERVLSGELPCSSQVAAQLNGRLASVLSGSLGRDHVVGSLSNREGQVIALISQGLTNKEIAHRLSIGVGTVKTHVHRALQKLSTHRRQDAVVQARGSRPSLTLLLPE